jgi:hypothetical protein
VAEPLVHPTEFSLAQNYPNPFSLGEAEIGGATHIQFSLPEPAQVSLAVYNALGQKIASVLDANMPPGFHETVWRGRDDAGRQVASGIYWLRLTSPKFTTLRKMMVVR